MWGKIAGRDCADVGDQMGCIKQSPHHRKKSEAGMVTNMMVPDGLQNCGTCSYPNPKRC